jgi:hypothetical protein
MQLAKPFFRLPRRFDVERLRAEVAAMPADAWAPHPKGIPGNTSVRLVSAEGGENDRLDGDMRATPHLARAPYIRQLLASFAVPWSRTRLLRLAPGASVPKHADTNYHWFSRVRVHIPVITRAGSAVSLRWGKRPYGRRRGLGVRQLAFAPRRESNPR